VYCNFHFSTSLKYKEEVLQAMLKEIEMQREYLQGATIETIYFGGGTPSLLSADDINRLFDAIFKFYPVAHLKECTLEANPDDLSQAYLKSLRGTPVSRFSIGIQSFRDEDLRYMKRAIGKFGDEARVAFAKVGVLMASARRTAQALHPTNLHVNKAMFPNDTIQSKLPDPEWLEHWLDKQIDFDAVWETKVVDRILHNMSLLMEQPFKTVQELNRFRKSLAVPVAPVAA
jgi:hypothetical protein